ncbi:MAG: hypothetical protein WA865_17175 [Spirulinaceae cyanobacterium]
MSNSDHNINRFNRLQPLDRVALGTILVILVLVSILLLVGDRTSVRVADFSWQNKQVGVGDRSFALTFNAPINPASVEKEALSIKPGLDGKVSWVGRRMFYNLTEIPAYETKYTVVLKSAKDELEPFSSNFITRDRYLAYIGVKGEEKGRLLLYNWAEKSKVILTPPALVVTDFVAYREGDKLLFSAWRIGSKTQKFSQQKLYTVTTGLNFASTTQAKPSGRLELILDAKDYQNLQFSLSPAEEKIIVQRVSRTNPGEFGLWSISSDQEAESLGIKGGEFQITPQGDTIAVAQTQGIKTFPLIPEASTEVLFSNYGRILDFSRQGSKVMVKFNPDATQSLFLVEQTGQGEGEAKEVLKTQGSIFSCQFEPRQEEALYCLITQRTEETTSEQSTLTLINLKTFQATPLIALPNQQAVKMNIAPDGSNLVFEQLLAPIPGSSTLLQGNDGQGISSGKIWLLNLPNIPSPDNLAAEKPQQLVPGFKPTWLP